MESINLFDIKRCWGNLAFDFVHSDSVGNSGGILCVWDSKAFKKLNATVSDYFIMVRGNWLSNGKLILFIAMYAPQELSEKRMLWDYLSYAIANWNGEVIIMGDFNEVRNKNERFGSLFNEKGARVFNSFISKTHLEDVPLGGCSFTWCHKSASKMSKLDRFLMSERLFRECPNFSAVTLERFLSDHRPILLRESNHDYRPSPFRFFHYWLEVEKLKFTKKKIRLWNGTRQCSKNKRLGLQQDLTNLDQIIDEGKVTVDIVNKRIEEFPNQLNAIQVEDLEAEVSYDEIKKAVWDCGIDKSPGPDGFTLGFYKRFWSLIDRDVVAA
nr:RNA-directed DNA polymerase, eukaryota, reverse transcriptase zinc-binding domain protein [Tanacetum cinerariifolium]